jgi:multidrug efflux pump subunit AcrB
MEPYRSNLEDLQLLTVSGTSGKLIHLQNVATVKEEVGPVQIDRYNRTRQITILVNLEREKKVLGEAVAELTEYLQTLDFLTVIHLGLQDKPKKWEMPSNILFLRSFYL